MFTFLHFRIIQKYRMTAHISRGIIFCLIIRVNWDPGRREIILKIRQELESKTDILS